MDGQFFEEAIEEFKKAAIAGDHAPACWELCGDCAHRLDRWEEAIRYYEIVYTYPNSPEELKYRVLRKLTRCSQNFRKTGFKEASSRRCGRERRGTTRKSTGGGKGGIIPPSDSVRGRFICPPTRGQEDFFMARQPGAVPGGREAFLSRVEPAARGDDLPGCGTRTGGQQGKVHRPNPQCPLSQWPLP